MASLKNRLRNITRSILTNTLAITCITCKARQSSTNMEQFRNLVEDSIQGICVHQDLKPLFVNQAYAELLGYQCPDQVLTLGSLEPHLAPHERARLHAYHQALIQGEKTSIQYEYDAVRQDGTPIVLYSVMRFIHWDGQPAIQSTVIDITARKRAEEQARQRQVELVHEVNQPLAAIVNYCDAALAMLQTIPDCLPELVYALEQAIKQAQRASRIIRCYKKNFVHKRATKKTCIDLNALVREAIELIGAEACDKRITLKLALAEHLPRLWVNRIQIEQVLVNLLHNSIEAIAKANSKVRGIIARTQLQDNEQVKVTIQDTGPGLEPTLVERAFDAFETSKAQGLGLGLAISRSIIEAHGGQLWAEVTGNGATFHFTLPLTME